MSSSSNRRVLALDGARALCILSVLFAHASGTGIIPITRLMKPAGDLGVRGFFVLSGFLITGLLLRTTGVRSASRCVTFTHAARCASSPRSTCSSPA
jgi:peptidoglycan/LPS O-acetylase OafA/YrhL